MANITNNYTVAQLRRAGHKVKVLNYRMARPRNMALNDPIAVSASILKKNKNWVIENFGGHTIIQITLKDGRNFEGLSVCAGIDNFSGDTSKKIALARALKDVEVDITPVPRLDLGA